MAGKQLTVRDVAARIGVAPGRVRAMLTVARRRRAAGQPATGHIPEPDGVLGGAAWWWAATIEAWIPTRPGPGTRTDRHPAGQR